MERLRVWLLASAGFLLLVIASFLGGAHYLRRHRVTLPKRLGIDIKQESDGFTYSQSMQGHTVFTLHAASEVEHADNKVTLHDVSIVLYGEKQDRNDRIYGDEFEYDKNAGVLRATGLVHIDLQAAQAGEAINGAGPGTKDSAGKPKLSAGAGDSARMLHVTTHGLVYLQDLGVAATSELLEFQSGAMKGQATGADYSRDTGLLLLHSNVTISGMAGKRPMTLTAATANLDNRNRQAFLSHAHCASDGQTVEADHATLHSRADGTLERVEADGNVTTVANGSRVVSLRADVEMDATSKPRRALLTGGVQYSFDQPLRQMRGQAGVATIDFDTRGEAQHAEFVGAVHIVERTRATEAALEPWSSRDLTAAKVEAALLPASAGRKNREQGAGNREQGTGGAGPTQLRDVEAIGSARLAVVNNGSLASAHGRATTELSADDLKAHLVAAQNAKQPPRLDTLAGRGNTMLHQATADGIDQVSSGDSLDVKFRAGNSARAGSASATNAKSGEGVDDLLSAVQMGNVTMTRRAPAATGGKLGGASGGSAIPLQDIEQATAQRAAYDGDLDLLTLSGGAQVSDHATALWADQVILRRSTGDAHATGSVKVNYLQSSSAQTGGKPPVGLRGTAPGATPPGNPALQSNPIEPTHVVADRADLVHATSVATFHGKPARLWQAGSQVQAPVIQLQRVEQRMIAHGESSGATGQVRTILANAGSVLAGTDQSGVAKAGGSKTPAEKSERLPGVVRVTSGALTYSGILRQAEFSGGVRAETIDGTIRSNEATVYLQDSAKGNAGSGSPSTPSNNAASALATPSLAGEVQRMVASGQVEIEQPGRRATGGRLVYTANDGTATGGTANGGFFVLTGDGKAQPKLVDAARGTITGAALQFHSGDDSVVVSSVEPGATGTTTGPRVRTETHAGKDATMRKGQ